MSGAERAAAGSGAEGTSKRGRYDPNTYFIDCGDLTAGDAQRGSLQGGVPVNEPDSPGRLGPLIEYPVSPASEENYSFSTDPHPFPESDLLRRSNPYHLQGCFPEPMISFTRGQSSSFSGDWTLFSYQPSALISAMSSLPEVSEKRESKNNPRCIHGKIKYVCKGVSQNN